MRDVADVPPFAEADLVGKVPLHDAVAIAVVADVPGGERRVPQADHPLLRNAGGTPRHLDGDLRSLDQQRAHQGGVAELSQKCQRASGLGAPRHEAEGALGIAAPHCGSFSELPRGWRIPRLRQRPRRCNADGEQADDHPRHPSEGKSQSAGKSRRAPHHRKG